MRGVAFLSWASCTPCSICWDANWRAAFLMGILIFGNYNWQTRPKCQDLSGKKVQQIFWRENRSNMMFSNQEASFILKTVKTMTLNTSHSQMMMFKVRTATLWLFKMKNKLKTWGDFLGKRHQSQDRGQRVYSKSNNR